MRGESTLQNVFAPSETAGTRHPTVMTPNTRGIDEGATRVWFELERPSGRDLQPLNQR